MNEDAETTQQDSDDELKQARDDLRCEASVQTIKDVLWRFEETSEGTHSLYDLLGYIVEDLVREGCCAACINETLSAVYTSSGANPDEHRRDEGTLH